MQSAKHAFLTETDAFRNHLIHLGYGKTTINDSPKHVAEFLSFINKNITDVTEADIEDYHSYLQVRPNKRTSGGLSDLTIQHQINSLKKFFAWQVEKQNILINPTDSIRLGKPKTQQFEILSQQEIKEVYASTNTLQERAILAVFYGCGVRRNEAEMLTTNDLNHGNRRLIIRKGKLSRRREIPLSQAVYNDIRNYVFRERMVKDVESALITTEQGKRMNGNAMNKAIKTILSRTIIDKQISLHSLRHSIGTHLIENGMSLDYVRDFLGHKDLASTQRYVRISEQQLRNIK